MKATFTGTNIINDLDGIRDQFIVIGKYNQNSRSNHEIVVRSCPTKPDLTVSEQAAIIEWGATQGYESVLFN